MTQEIYDRATDLIEEIKELQSRKEKVVNTLPLYAPEYPEQTNAYIKSIKEVIDAELEKLQKEFSEL